jgi:hypothetical protein
MKADRMGVTVNHRIDRLVLRAFGQIFKLQLRIGSSGERLFNHEFRLSQTLEETKLKRSVKKGFW